MMLKQKLKPIALLFFCGFVIPLIGNASSLEELELQCEDARERHLAPLREEAIGLCIKERESSRSSGDPREHCERFYEDFGNGGTTQSGGFRQRMFHDIPQCQELHEAEMAGRTR
jgi:hypothetical protein